MPNVFSGTFTRRFLPHFSRVGQHRGGIIHFGLIRLSRQRQQLQVVHQEIDRPAEDRAQILVVDQDAGTTFNSVSIQF